MANTKTTGSSKSSAKTKKSTAAQSGSSGNGHTATDTEKKDEGVLSNLKKNISRITSSKKVTLKTLLENELNDVYNAEKQLVEALPKMAKAAQNPELKAAFNHHLQQTKKHIERLDMVFKNLKIEKEDKTCEAMEGLVEEGDEILSEFDKGPVRDAAMIIGAQKIEHYEIAAYGSVAELADVLGFHKAADILERTLREEEETDKLLTEIARDVNDEACDLADNEGEEDEEKDEDEKPGKE